MLRVIAFTPQRRLPPRRCAPALVASIGAAPGFWQAATQADFLRGEVENLSIDEHGRLMLGPGSPPRARPRRAVRLDDAAAPDGSFFLGTGNDGKVVRVDRDGNGSGVLRQRRDGSARAGAGTRTAGSMSAPRRTAASTASTRKGQATPFFDPDDKYIWALAVDPQGHGLRRDGRQGRRLSHHARRQGRRVSSRRKTTHAVSLALDRSGQLLVGTGAPGRVFRVDARGQRLPAARHAVSGNARAASRSDKGVLYVAAQSGRAAQGGDSGAIPGPTEPSTPAPVPTVSTEITSIAIIDVPVTPQPAASFRRQRRSPRADRRGLSRAARWPVGSALGVARRRAVRRGDRGRRRAAGGDRRQGKDLPARRRSDAPDAADARQRAAGDDAAPHRRPHAHRDVESRACCSRCRRRAPSAAPTNRT